MTKLPDGFQRLGGSPAEMVAELAKRTGGIPDFAKNALLIMGLSEEDIEAADKAEKEEK